MKLRCRIGWHRYDHHITEVIYGVRIEKDKCECGDYRNLTWTIL